MSFFGRNNISVDKPRDAYRPLLWENLLRDYQCHPHKSQQHKSDLPKPNLSKPHFAKRNSDEPKKVVDLNKKMKILRVKSKEEEANKQNMQDNGNTYCYESASSGRSEHSDILNSIEQIKEEKKVKFIDIQEFMCDEKSQPQHQQLKSEQKLSAQQIKQPLSNQAICSESNAVCSSQAISSQSRSSDIVDDLPEVIQPIRQLSKCQIMPERKQSIMSQMEEDKIIEQPQDDNLQEGIEKNYTNGQIAQQFHEENIQQKNQQDHNIHQEPIDEQIPQIKSRLSLRILKKKLKKHSIQQVAEYVADHRRIVLNGCISQPKKKTIYQAIVSYIKHELIG